MNDPVEELEGTARLLGRIHRMTRRLEQCKDLAKSSNREYQFETSTGRTYKSSLSKSMVEGLAVARVLETRLSLVAKRQRKAASTATQLNLAGLH